MSKKFNTSYGTAGGKEYGYKSGTEARRARAKTKALNKSKYPIHEKHGSWLAPGHWKGKNVGKGITSTSESRSGFGGRDNS